MIFLPHFKFDEKEIIENNSDFVKETFILIIYLSYIGGASVTLLKLLPFLPPVAVGNYIFIIYYISRKF